MESVQHARQQRYERDRRQYLLFNTAVIATGQLDQRLRDRATDRCDQAAADGMLLDQRIVAGLGNIYVCEALYRARISPLTPAGKVSKPRLETLAEMVTRDTSADMIDSTVVRAHHCAVGLKKGIKSTRGLAGRAAASPQSSTLDATGTAGRSALS